MCAMSPLSQLRDLPQQIVGRLRREVMRYVLAYPRVVECNLCGWQARRFLSDDWHPHTVCCRCGSQVRHRLLAAALTHLPSYSEVRIVKNKRILHFAPERTLRQRLQRLAARYETADLMHARLGRMLDISNMPSIADGEFNLVIACDVLEHVADDIAAMREIRRVLAPGGYAILSVPQKDDLATTFEDPAITSPRDRERAYGQWDHVRIYGNDFVSRLSGAGLVTTVVDESSFPDAIVRRHVLFPPVLSPHPLATNHRKIFFAQRPSA
jgi:SAM-dependent methyltransferase